MTTTNFCSLNTDEVMLATRGIGRESRSRLGATQMAAVDQLFEIAASFEQVEPRSRGTCAVDGHWIDAQSVVGAGIRHGNVNYAFKGTSSALHSVSQMTAALKEPATVRAFHWVRVAADAREVSRAAGVVVDEHLELALLARFELAAHGDNTKCSPSHGLLASTAAITKINARISRAMEFMALRDFTAIAANYNKRLSSFVSRSRIYIYLWTWRDFLIALSMARPFAIETSDPILSDGNRSSAHGRCKKLFIWD